MGGAIKVQHGRRRISDSNTQTELGQCRAPAQSSWVFGVSVHVVTRRISFIILNIGRYVANAYWLLAGYLPLHHGLPLVFPPLQDGATAAFPDRSK